MYTEINITKSFQLVYPKARLESVHTLKTSKEHNIMTSLKNYRTKLSYSVLLISAGNANEFKRNSFLNNFFR